MKVLITGVTGAVGPFVIAELEKEHELTLFSRRPVESKHQVALGDLRSLEDCRRAADGVEAVVHLGANSEPASEAFEVNVQGTYHLMEAAREAGVERVIFASTNCVYGHCFPITDRKFPLVFLPIDETHPCYPEDNYGISKVLDEEMLALYSRTWSMRTAALRLTWVWGPKEIRWRSEMEAFDTQKYAPYFWSYVDARDTAQAFRQALEASNLPAHGVYNITAADHMADEDSTTLAAQYYSDTPQRGDLTERVSFFECSAAQQAFGYEPQYSWRDGWKSA